MRELKAASAGLRSHDIHQGLTDVDRGRGLVAHELRATQLVGMAGALATSIKGVDLVEDAQALRQIAAEQLDIDIWAFEEIITLLEEVEFIRNRQRAAVGTTTFYESVPEDFERLYGTLGEVWTERVPGELERCLLLVVEDLSFGPRPLDELDVDPAALASVRRLGEAAEAVKIIPVAGRSIAYSPFFAYEHPENVGEILANADIERVRTAFETVRGYQGLPGSIDEVGALAQGLVGRGLMAGPTLERPDGAIETFAVAPYGLSPELLTFRRPVLEKGLAIVAAARMGENFGGATNLSFPVAVLRRLLEPERIVARHTSTRRQYAVLHRMGVVRFSAAGMFTGIQLIDTKDNREAVNLAIELLSHGEAILARGGTVSPAALLMEGTYRTQIQAVRPARNARPLSGRLVQDLFEAAMGRRPIE